MVKNKSKKIIRDLVRERYLVWTILFAVLVAAGLLTQISLAKTQMDTDISSSMFLVRIKHK